MRTTILDFAVSEQVLDDGTKTFVFTNGIDECDIPMSEEFIGFSVVDDLIEFTTEDGVFEFKGLDKDTLAKLSKTENVLLVCPSNPSEYMIARNAVEMKKKMSMEV